MKKALILLLVLSVTFPFLAGCRQEPYGIRFDREVYDFGEIEVGTDVSHVYVFVNTGVNTLVIKSVQPSCGCTTTADWDREIAPGKSGKIPITFKPPTFNGETIKYINVGTNVPGRESIRLTLKGKTIIPIDVVPLNTWLGEIGKDTNELSGTYAIKNNTRKRIKILEVTPPRGNIAYNLSVVKDGYEYRLDYSMAPPFDGNETVTKEFTIRTDDKKHEYVHPKFFYFVPPPVRVYPKQVYIDMSRLSRANVYDVDVKSGMDIPIGILGLSLRNGNGITCSVKENVKGKYFQISLTVPVDFVFPEIDKPLLAFRVLNDPDKTQYSIPIDTLANRKQGD